MDRLTTLMERFEMNIVLAEPDVATLLVLADENNRPCRVLYQAETTGRCNNNIVFAADVQWGGVANPLLAALPTKVELSLIDQPDLVGLITLLQSEFDAPRCGGPSVLRRLAEVLMVRLLRHQIQEGDTEVGLLAGLSDPRLSRAIVAIHDRPGRGWTNGDLAQEAGLSLSRFSEIFTQKVGMTPMAYLRHWRLTVAYQDLQRGDRVDQVARRVGYVAPEAFSRAFRKRYGHAPVSLRSGATDATV
ncbi:MAG: helix-turn-helix transcriptional regulator [Thalassovita sp.]